MITTLIDKQDNFEIIRSQIAAILTLEVANQKVLAAAALKDPLLWDMKIFEERANAWEQFLNDPPEGEDRSPIVNVWFDNSNFNEPASNIMERQNSITVFNIDIYGYGVSSDEPSGGQNPGDREAAFENQRAIRLVRNILMASDNTYLQLQGLVWSRWPQSITSFQPELNGTQLQNVVGARIEFKVSFNEFAPQYEPVDLELLSVLVLRAEDGEIVIEADYDYTAP